MKKKIKYIQQEITIASGQAANTREFHVDTDPGYPVLTGLSLRTLSDGGLTNSAYDLGLKIGGSVVFEGITNTLLDQVNGASPNDKFLDQDLEVRGRKLTSQITTDSITSSEFKAVVTFRTESYEEQ